MDEGYTPTPETAAAASTRWEWDQPQADWCDTRTGLMLSWHAPFAPLRAEPGRRC